MKSQPIPGPSRVARSVACVLLAMSVIMSGGCAVNPYIDNPRPTEQDNPEKRATRAAGLKPGTMEFSLRYLDNTYEAYDAKVVEEHTRQQGLAAGLIALTGLALGAAAADHTTAVRNLAIGGATLFTLGNWNTNASRKDIYREGQRALTCAKEATSPLAAGDQRINRLRRLAGEMKTTYDGVADAKGSVSGQLMRIRSFAGAGSLPSVRTAEAEIVTTDAVMARARNAASAAEQLEGKFANAGIMLEGRVDAIRTIVNKALDGTAAALSQLPSALASISSSMDIVVPGASKLIQPLVKGEGTQPLPKPGTQEAMTEVVAPEKELAAATGKLIAAREKLENSVTRITGTMSESLITTDEVRAALKKCGVDVAAAIKPLALDSPAIEFDPGVQKSTEVTVSLGTGTQPFAAQFVTVPAKGLNVKVMGRSVQVTATAEAEPSSRHVVRVSDATGAQVELTVTIRAKDAGKGNGSGNTSTATKPQCFGQQDRTMWTQERVCLLQKLIDTKVDGNFGDNSCAAYVTKGPGALDYTKAKDGQVDKDALQKIFAKYELGANPTATQVAAKAKSVGCPDPPAAATPTNATAPVAASPQPAAAAPAGNSLTTAAVSAVFEKCPAPASGQPASLPGARAPDECKITGQKLLAIRARLTKWRPINSTLMEFDEKELRVVLAAFQKDNELPQQRGTLDGATDDAIANKLK